MKKVLFVRHAKSSWDNMTLSDKDRPLNARGLKDAPYMAHKCNTSSLAIDLIISSPANRALTTAQFFHKEYQIKTDIVLHNFLYHGDIEDYEEALSLVDDGFEQVAIFGHNPGLTYLVNQLKGADYIDNVPTCGVVVAEIDIDHWSDFSVPKATYKDFLFPKQ